MLVGFPTHDPQPIFELVVRAGRKICGDNGSEPLRTPTMCRKQTRPRKILWPSGHPKTKYLQCGKLRPMGIVGPVDNSVSRDSDRFLAVGAVTQSDRLEIELVQRPDTPAAILIKWPPQPTVTDPAKLTATIAAIVRVLGMAQIELAARRASGKFKRSRQTHEVVLRRS